MARSILYVGDQQPSLPATVTNAAGTAMDLTGYTSVVFALRRAYDTTNTFKLSATFVAPRSAGGVRYDFGSGDLAGLTPGVYVGQWVLTDAASRPQHVPAGEFEVRTGF